MELNGKKINFLGDSITFGHGVADPENIYCNRIGKKYGATVRNYGISGTRIARQQHPVDWETTIPDWSFCARVEDMDPDADIIVVFGGTNDRGHGDAPFGTMDDRTVDTFYGACHTLYTRLIDKYPTATIVVMTPLHCSTENSDRGYGLKPTGTPTLKEYVAAIKEVASYYSIPVLDLFAVSGISAEKKHVELFMPDGLHPNDDGQAIIASRLAGFLESL